MRNNFVRQIHEEMKKNPAIVFLTGDLGFNALETLQKNYPDRFINVGIAEANMIGIAAGLALTGKKVIAYSIASFITMRAYEQIRNDICYHNLDVKIIGTGGGYNYGNHGVTHHTVEDLAIMSVLPHMKVLSPSYAWEAQEATRAIIQDTGPAYMRLGKNPSTDFFQPHFKFEIGKGFVIREGSDMLLIITGNILDYAMTIAKNIKKKTDLEVCVLSMPTVKPLDEKIILKKMKDVKLVATLEEHSLHGGLGSQVAMVLARSGLHKQFRAYGIPDHFIKAVGGRDFLLTKAGLDPETITKDLIKEYKKNDK